MRPNLKSVLSSFDPVRHLKEAASCSQVLWITHTGLEAFEGIGSLPHLRELYASYNKISCLEPLIGEQLLLLLLVQAP